MPDAAEPFAELEFDGLGEAFESLSPLLHPTSTRARSAADASPRRARVTASRRVPPAAPGSGGVGPAGADRALTVAVRDRAGRSSMAPNLRWRCREPDTRGRHSGDAASPYLSSYACRDPQTVAIAFVAFEVLLARRSRADRQAADLLGDLLRSPHALGHLRPGVRGDEDLVTHP